MEEFCTPETRLLCCAVKTCVSCAAVNPVCPLQGTKVVTFRYFGARKQQQNSFRFDVEQLQSIEFGRFYLEVCGCDKTVAIDATTAKVGAKFW